MLQSIKEKEGSIFHLHLHRHRHRHRHLPCVRASVLSLAAINDNRNTTKMKSNLSIRSTSKYSSLTKYWLDVESNPVIHSSISSHVSAVRAWQTLPSARYGVEGLYNTYNTYKKISSIRVHLPSKILLLLASSPSSTDSTIATIKHSRINIQ